MWGLRPDSLVEVRPPGRVEFSHQALHHCTMLQEHSRVSTVPQRTSQYMSGLSVYLACSPPAAQLSSTALDRTRVAWRAEGGGGGSSTASRACSERAPSLLAAVQLYSPASPGSS